MFCNRGSFPKKNKNNKITDNIVDYLHWLELMALDPVVYDDTQKIQQSVEYCGRSD